MAPNGMRKLLIMYDVYFVGATVTAQTAPERILDAVVGLLLFIRPSRDGCPVGRLVVLAEEDDEARRAGRLRSSFLLSMGI